MERKSRGRQTLTAPVFLGVVALCLQTLRAEPIHFAYRFNEPQKVEEEKFGAVSDGDLATMAYWKANRASVICEFQETTALSWVEVTVRKVTNWYLMEEVEVSQGDGCGHFVRPVSVRTGIGGYDGKGPVVDASCTNLTFRISVAGSTSMVRVNVKGAGWGSIAEIRIDGTRRSRVGTTCALSASDKAKKTAEENLVTVENGQYKLVFTPFGGRARSVYSKFLDAEMTDWEGGTFNEFDWSKSPNRFFYREKPFMLKPFASAGVRGLEATGNFRGGGTDFLVIGKRFSIEDDSTSIKVDYTFANLPDAMSALDYALLIHSTLGINGRLCSYYYPSEEGIVEVRRDKRPRDLFVHHPSRGWMAAVDDFGRGVAITMPLREVSSFFSWFSTDPVPTMEWRMTPVTIDCGKSYAVSTEVIAFRGLGKVSGAGGGLVGEIGDGKVTVFSSRAGKVTAVAGGKAVELAFGKFGEIRSFASDAKVVILKRAGVEVCRLEAPPEEGPWTMPPLEKGRASSAKSIDLTGYTNFPHQACAPFAKPLAIRRPRVIALTAYDNAVELGFFRDRFDCELLTTMVASEHYIRPPKKRTLRDPIYDSGDYFGNLATSDIERNLKNTLAKEADVILVGGLPWEIFPWNIQQMILEKVKSGVGLVWIGQDAPAPEICRNGACKYIANALPEAVTSDFADVPFALLGKEPLFAFKTDGIVHARADEGAYLTEDRLGKGRILHLAYEAIFGVLHMEQGITPNLHDFYPDRVAPVEHYYSLVAKCLLRAAGLVLPVSFGRADVTGERAALTIRAESDVVARATYSVRTAFGATMVSREKTLSLRKGGNAVTLPLKDVWPYAGALSCEVVLRDASGRVLNWGAWAFEKPPAATIASFAADKSAPGRTGWREGDTVSYAAKVAGDRTGRAVRFRVQDNYGRLLQERTQPAAETVCDAFKIENALPARTYEVTAILMEGNREIDRRRVEVRVRPDPAKWPWDDFFFGVWTGERVREYLWPELARHFRAMHLTTNIANQRRMAIDFAARYGFEPTLLTGAGLGQCGEPPAYVKSGDKLDLIRTPCLSDPAFFTNQDKGVSKLAKEIADIGIRYVWFGDEQSLTGYGGRPIDFCFSVHCLKAFRAFLKTRYGSLERLNAAWETSFEDWGSVLPFTRQEVWTEGGERHIAGWADHLEFMDGRLANSIAYTGRILKAADANVATSVSGTQPPTAYGGMDWWKQVGVLDGALDYETGGQLELHRSFKPDGQFMPWNWGYAQRGERAVNGVWRTAFVGCRGIMGYIDDSICNPDWTWSRGYAEVKPAMDRLAAGVGKHLIHNLKAKPSVAILYSQASIRAAYFENREKEHSQLREKYIALLHHLGHAFDFVSYEQLADGTFESRGYKALILADATAMGDAEVAAVGRFAAKGGAVFAEGVPAVREGNCRRRGRSPLERFAVVRKPSVAYLKALEYPDEPDNAKLIAAEQDRLEDFLAESGVRPPRLAVSENGKRVRTLSVYAREGRGGALFYGVLTTGMRDGVADFVFPKQGHLHDLASGRYLGEGDRFRLPLAPSRPYAFELLDVRPTVSDLKVADGHVSFSYPENVDSVVSLRVYRPDGSEAECYARKLVVKDGKGAWTIPFALSDPKGTWRVTATDVLENRAHETSFIH